MSCDLRRAIASCLGVVVVLKEAGELTRQISWLGLFVAEADH